MARPRKKNFKNLKDWDFSGPKLNVSPETKESISAVFLLLLGILSFFSLIDLAGTIGVYLNTSLQWLLGSLRWLAPLIFVLVGYFLLRPAKYPLHFSSWLGLVSFVLSFTGLVHLLTQAPDLSGAAKLSQGGGYLGLLLSYLLLKATGFWGGLVLLLALFLIGIFLFFNISFADLSKLFSQLGSFAAWLREVNLRRRVKQVQKVKKKLYAQKGGSAEPEPDFEVREVEIDQEPAPRSKTADGQAANLSVKEEDEESKELSSAIKKFQQTKIDLPLSLLNGQTGKPNGGDLEANKLIIQKTLKNFGIEAEMGEAQVGPTVTQYTLKPAEGVKLSRITSLNDNLALALAAHPIRIEAPIPGRALVGIEVPNTAKAIVPLRDILVSEQFKTRRSNLMIALGMDVMGRPWLSDIKKMPHLLIAGSTGSGKSVCINSIILSLLFQNGPGELKFIMVDPKRVEFPVYSGIPHLLAPIIVDNNKAVNALKWSVGEMERRFEVLSEAKVRDIQSYNVDKKVIKSNEILPYILIIIDELADLMTSKGREVETLIVRIAQMARAVGIHLILATQRPSVEIITGLIKANITARMAFQVG